MLIVQIYLLGVSGHYLSGWLTATIIFLCVSTWWTYKGQQPFTFYGYLVPHSDLSLWKTLQAKALFCVSKRGKIWPWKWVNIKDLLLLDSGTLNIRLVLLQLCWWYAFFSISLFSFLSISFFQFSFFYFLPLSPKQRFISNDLVQSTEASSKPNQI